MDWYVSRSVSQLVSQSVGQSVSASGFSALVVLLAQDDARRYFLQRLWSDAFHIVQFANTLEIAVFVAVINDCLCSNGSDAF